MKKVIVYIVLLIAITFAVRSGIGTLDTPIVYKSNSTGALHIMTNVTYPRVILITEDDLPIRYSLIWTR